jgi:UDP-2-acetamido-3-amino-2,3-dideoxy-glucuronate N-acetyltransferase
MALSYFPGEAVSRGFLELEPGSSVAESVRIVPIDDRGATEGPIRVGRNVIVRDGCILCSGVVIGDNTVVGNNTVIRSGARIGRECAISHLVCIEQGASLGDRVRVAALTHITSGCLIEDEVLIGARVAAVRDAAVPREASRQAELKAPVLRRRCRIGSGAIVLGDVEIGANTLVAAGSMVASSLPPDVVAGGVPAAIQQGPRDD